jgi:histone H3/H4
MDEDATLKSAEAEAAALRAKIEQTPEARRLRVLEKFINDYRSIEPVQRIVARYQSKLKYGRPGSAAAILCEASEAYLKKIKRRAMSGEIAEHIKEKGISISGNPTATLSSYLSTCNLFDNRKGEGYGLVEWSKTNEAAAE